MLSDLLAGYAEAVLESALATGRAEETASGLAEFSYALTESSELRRALIDSSVSPVARRAIAAELLDGRGTAEARSLIAFAVRVAPPNELPVSLGDVVAIAERVVAAGIADLDVLGRTVGSRDRLRGYTERVLEELASAADIDQIEDEIFSVAKLLDSQADLRHVLEDGSTALAGRLGILSDLFSARLGAESFRLVAFVLRARRRNLVATLEWLVELAASERGRRVAEVRSAVELDEAERARLGSALEILAGRPVEVRVLLDADVIGGVLISLGDLVIDGTVRLRVERLRDALLVSS